MLILSEDGKTIKRTGLPNRAKALLNFNGRPKVMTTCPFCSTPQEYDKLHTRFYECGTTADRDNGNYTRKCRGIG